MTTTVGQPEHRAFGEDWRHPTANPWALEAVAARGYTDLDMVESVAPDEEPENVSPAGGRRSLRTIAAARAAIADALGIDVTELDESLDIDELTDILIHDLTDPQAAFDALDRALDEPRRAGEPKATPGESDGAYRVREGNWRVRTGLPRKRKSVPPSRMPEARRARHIAKKADRLGISVDEAARLTKRRVRRA
jgi:hypothetical protein